METIAMILLIAIATIGAIGIGTGTQLAQARGFTGNDNTQGNDNSGGNQDTGGNSGGN